MAFASELFQRFFRR